MEMATTGLVNKFKPSAISLLSQAHAPNNSMVNRRSNPQLIGWLAPTAHPAHGGTDERPAS
jgi:hypothetical protein